MKGLFYVLLMLGIISTISSVYFLNTNSVYAIFTATIGVMLVGFSVFEISSIKKGEKKEKKAKGEDLEWTYYDKKKKISAEVEKELKFTPVSRLFSFMKLKKKPTISGKEVEKELKKEVEKIEKSVDKFTKVRAYIKESLDKNIPKAKIIEACIAADWPREEIDNAFEEFGGKRFDMLYVLFGGIFVMLFGLILSGNFLIGYWLETLKMSFSWIYYILILGMFGGIGIIGIALNENVAKKKRVQHVIRDKKVTEIKTKLATTKTVDVGAEDYATDIDRLLAIVNEKEKLTVESVGEIFGITKAEAEQWGKILKDQDLILLYYPTVGEVELRKKKNQQQKEE